jgi:hypothetical protein
LSITLVISVDTALGAAKLTSLPNSPVEFCTMLTAFTLLLAIFQPAAPRPSVDGCDDLAFAPSLALGVGGDIL